MLADQRKKKKRKHKHHKHKKDKLIEREDGKIERQERYDERYNVSLLFKFLHSDLFACPSTTDLLLNARLIKRVTLE